MYKIAWNTTKNLRSATADVGDIHLTLSGHNKYWMLTMGIRVYTSDRSKSMVRPPATVASFPTAADIEEAKLKAEEYFTDFITSVLNSLTKE